jgi:hypothetical protein
MNVPKYEFGLESPEGPEINLTGHCGADFYGCVGGVDPNFTGRVNVRRIGFVREPDLDIPIYWEDE